MAGWLDLRPGASVVSIASLLEAPPQSVEFRGSGHISSPKEELDEHAEAARRGRHQTVGPVFEQSGPRFLMDGSLAHPK